MFFNSWMVLRSELEIKKYLKIIFKYFLIPN